MSFPSLSGGKGSHSRSRRCLGGPYVISPSIFPTAVIGSLAASARNTMAVAIWACRSAIPSSSASRRALLASESCPSPAYLALNTQAHHRERVDAKPRIIGNNVAASVTLGYKHGFLKGVALESVGGSFECRRGSRYLPATAHASPCPAHGAEFFELMCVVGGEYYFFHYYTNGMNRSLLHAESADNDINYFPGTTMILRIVLPSSHLAVKRFTPSMPLVSHGLLCVRAGRGTFRTGGGCRRRGVPLCRRD